MAIRLGFIGAGNIARSHMERLLTMSNVEITAISDINADTMKQTAAHVNERLAVQDTANKLQAVHYTDYNVMLRNEKLDGVFVCLPPFVRGAPELAVVEAGLPLFSEKPIGLNLDYVGQIGSALEERQIINAVGYQLRYLPSAQIIKRTVAETTVGMALVMRFGGVPPLPWYGDQEKSGGQLVDMATHHVDQLRYFLGEVRTVYAAAATRINDKYFTDWSIFDVNCMTLTFDSGVVANLANNTISGYGVPADARGVHIFGDGVTLSQNLGRPLEITTADGVEQIPDTVDAMLLQDEAFVTAVATGNAQGILSDYVNGIKTLAVTLAAEASARSGQVIHVQDWVREQAPAVGRLISNSR